MPKEKEPKTMSADETCAVYFVDDTHWANLMCPIMPTGYVCSKVNNELVGRLYDFGDVLFVAGETPEAETSPIKDIAEKYMHMADEVWENLEVPAEEIATKCEALREEMLDEIREYGKAHLHEHIMRR